MGLAVGAGLPSICKPDDVLQVESYTLDDPAPDDDVASDLCDFFDFDEVELFSVRIE